MPHVDLPLNVASPADGDFLKDGDDSIRKLTRQLLEVLTDLVVDPAADPLVLKASSIGSSSLVDGSVTAAKLAQSIGLRSSALVSTAITLSLSPEATAFQNLASLSASPGQLVLPFWSPTGATEAQLLGRIQVTGYVDTPSLITLVFVNTASGTSVSFTAKTLNILLINTTPVGT